MQRPRRGALRGVNKAVEAVDRVWTRPVDLSFLARQTMGNRDLEREVLHLFIRQSERCIAKLAEPGAPVVELAHAILGSARGIGANGVAAAAEDIETKARSGALLGEGEFSRLAVEVETANRFIRAILVES